MNDYCKRPCPIKELGKCDPESCKVLPVDDPLAQKVFFIFPDAVKSYLEKHCVVISCGGEEWATLKDDREYEEREAERKRRGWPARAVIPYYGEGEI